jgi:hypothetical protein
MAPPLWGRHAGEDPDEGEGRDGGEAGPGDVRAPGEASPADQRGPESVRAGAHGAATGRDMSGNALGDGASATYIAEQHVHPPAEPEPIVWPVLVGSVPPLASAFQPRSPTKRLAATGERVLGPEHPNTMSAAGTLAAWHHPR